MITPKENTAIGTGNGDGDMIITGCCHATYSIPCPICRHSIPLGESECPLVSHRNHNDSEKKKNNRLT